jgi:hypothetical protein
MQSTPGHHVFACFVQAVKPPKKPPPDVFACQVISDEEADNMELEEETEYVSSSNAPTGSLGGSIVHPFPTPTARQTILLVQT